MAYDVYWTGYDFSMDIEALQALGIPKERHYFVSPDTQNATHTFFLPFLPKKIFTFSLFYIEKNVIYVLKLIFTLEQNCIGCYDWSP